VIKKGAPVTVISAELPVPVQEVESGYQEAAATAETAEVKQEQNAPAQATQFVVSPGVGIFYADVTVGQSIKAGKRVGRCTVDALQLSSDIVASVDGEVVEILVADGQFVDFGKALLAVKSLL